MKACKTCILCKHFEFRSGSPGYSEYTPGWNASMYCRKNRIDIDIEEITEDQFRATLMKAETCPDFEDFREVHP